MSNHPEDRGPWPVDPAQGTAGPAGSVDRTDDHPVGAPAWTVQRTGDHLVGAPDEATWVGGEIEPGGPSPRSLTLSVGMLLTATLLALLVVLPAPYAVSSPGPTRDVLGEHDGTPMIQIEGAPTFDSTGELRLTTVSATGSPQFPSSTLGVIEGWFSSSRVVVPVEDVFPPETSQEEIDESNSAEMVSSQENATVAALNELGFEVPVTLTVAGVLEGTNADGVVEEGDVVVALDGTPIDDYAWLVGALADVTPGDTVTLTVERDGAELDLPVVTTENADGGAQIGVFLDPTFDFPVDVTISIDDIGGPSAGTIFALGIVDELTEDDELAGEVVAGTGTMDVTGEVGPIGGIRQKLAGASRDGAAWFLAPAANCGEVVGHVPAGLRVVSVATLHEAREAMEAIGAGAAQDLPTCTG